jgi:hypothetical protein
MTLTIHIDEEILRRASRPGGDLTLRVVIDSPTTHAEPEPVGPPRGPLAVLLERGDLKPKDELHWHRPRLKVTHFATVLANGELEIAGVRYGSPSDAASAVAGSSANGWTAWRREDGKTLDQLR